MYKSFNNFVLVFNILILKFKKKDHSIVIATYALCGFSNFGMIGKLN